MASFKKLKNGVIALATAASLALGAQVVSAQNTDLPSRPLTAQVTDYDKKHKGLELVLETDVNVDGKKERLIFNKDGTKFLKTEGGLVKRRNKDFFLSKKSGRSATIFSRGSRKYVLNLDIKNPEAIRGSVVPLDKLKIRNGQYAIVLADTPGQGAFIYKSKGRKFSKMANFDADSSAEFFNKYAPVMNPLLSGETVAGPIKDTVPTVPADPTKVELKKEPAKKVEEKAPVAKDPAPAKEEVKKSSSLELLTTKACPLTNTKEEVQKKIAEAGYGLDKHLAEVYAAIPATKGLKDGEIKYAIRVAFDIPVKGSFDVQKLKVLEDSIGYAPLTRSLSNHLRLDMQVFHPSEGCADIIYTFKNKKEE